MANSVLVYYRDKKAGLLKKTEDGYEFEYNPIYLNDSDAKPVSLTMPLSQKKFFSKYLFPFFENLLPEGFLLDMTVAKLKIDKNDKFRLLQHVGQDTVGAVSIKPMGESS
jgi:serine/threonine-protein kinase HipA